jgi:nicotinate-nucleotide adenylyltransferase
MKIGIFGGTFDPPHNGHLMIAEYVRDRLGLERIAFVPSWISPHKQDRQTAGAEHRIAMLQLAVASVKGAEVSDIEIARGGISYTVDTLTEFHKKWSECNLSLIIGSDNFREFGSWKDPEKILSLAQLVVMHRPGVEPPEAGTDSRVKSIIVPEIRISSTGIRERIQKGESIGYLVPSEIEQYIILHRLYR